MKNRFRYRAASWDDSHMAFVWDGANWLPYTSWWTDDEAYDEASFGEIIYETDDEEPKVKIYLDGEQVLG